MKQKIISPDGRNRISLGDWAQYGYYQASIDENSGVITLEPVVVLTVTEMDNLVRPVSNEQV